MSADLHSAPEPRAMVPMPEDFDPNHLEWTRPMFYGLGIMVLIVIAAAVFFLR